MPYSKDMKIIGSMWKFKLMKRDSKGNINKYKAWLVARGDQLELHLRSYYEYSSLRVILALA